MRTDDLVYPDLYFGRPGALVTLPWSREGIAQPYERPVYEFVSAAGTRRVSKLVGGARSFSLNWRALGLETYAKIEAYDSGLNGVGPWAFINPSRVNMLSANQSSATGYGNVTTGFSTTATNQGTPGVNADTTQIHRTGGARSLRWQFTTAPAASPLLTLPHPYSGWYGVPAVPTKPYVFSVWLKADGVTDVSITVSARISWRTAVDGAISEVTSGDVAVGGWTRLTVTGTAPSNAVFVAPRLVALGSSITTGGSLYADEMQLEFGSTATDWVPGTGCMPVETLGLSEDVTFAGAFRSQPKLALREVI